MPTGVGIKPRVAIVAVAVRTSTELHTAAGTGIFELKVHHAGDGIRAVLGRCAVAQHLRLPERDGRDDGEVRTLSAVSDAVSQPLNDRRVA